MLKKPKIDNNVQNYILSVRRTIISIILILVFIMIITPFLKEYYSKKKFNEEILQQKPVVVKVKEITLNDKGFIFTKPTKVLIQIVKDQGDENSSILKLTKIE